MDAEGGVAKTPSTHGAAAAPLLRCCTADPWADDRMKRDKKMMHICIDMFDTNVCDFDAKTLNRGGWKRRQQRAA